MKRTTFIPRAARAKSALRATAFRPTPVVTRFGSTDLLLARTVKIHQDEEGEKIFFKKPSFRGDRVKKGNLNISKLSSIPPEMLEKARAIADSLYDRETEGEIEIPQYNGWTSEIDEQFQKRTRMTSCQGKKDKFTGICESVEDLVGYTPMLRMSRLATFLGIPHVEMLAKCENFNGGGSVKDRNALEMIEQAERAGLIKPGDLIIEPSSGNAGIGFAMFAAIKGYKAIITMPSKNRGEKSLVMQRLGAEIIETPNGTPGKQDSSIFLARRLAKALGGFNLDQYLNVSNPCVHLGTADEIIEQCEGNLDYMVAGVGTGGTITGISRRIKEVIPQCEIIGVDPYGSIMADVPPNQQVSERTGDKPGSHYTVEGIGHDYLPSVFDRSLVDHWVKTDDDESCAMARDIIRHESLFIGASSGSAVVGAFRFIKSLPHAHGKRICVLMPDSTRNYINKFMDDSWMTNHGYGKMDWTNASVPW